MSGRGLGPDDDVTKLAPKFRDAVLATLAACRAIDHLYIDPIETTKAWKADRLPEINVAFWFPTSDMTAMPATAALVPFDPIVWEAMRSAELQALYYARGTSKAKSPLFSWHGYGLAVDVISQRYFWFGRNRDGVDEPTIGPSWFAAMAGVARYHGLDSGLDWHMRDSPHLQWGLLNASPSARGRALFAEGGAPAVWRAVRAA